MKLAACIFTLQTLLFLHFVSSRVEVTTSTSAFDPDVLKNALSIIEHRMAVQGAETFQCIFFDMDSKNPYNVILNDLLRSPILEHVGKFVVQGLKRQVNRYPKNPSLLVLHPGYAQDLLSRNGFMNINRFLQHLNPGTPVLVVMDFRQKSSQIIYEYLARGQFRRVTYLNMVTGHMMLACEYIHTAANMILDNPASIEMWHQKALRQRSIYYVSNNITADGRVALEWIIATAKYLNVGATEYNEDEMEDFDILLEKALIVNTTSGNYRVIYENALEICRIAIHKGKPLNAIEIMMMPFNWQVWTLLLVIFVLAEVAKRVVPDLLQNDPILHVVCGFEKHNLNQAARREKFILISLVVLMFFMTNAFETKVISLMISKPWIQHVKSLADFDKYGLKFRYDPKKNPSAGDNAVIGKYVVYRNDTNIIVNEPGYAFYVARSMIRQFLNFPEIIFLDEEYFDGVLGYRLGLRSIYVEALQFTLTALEEAGLFDLWRDLWTKRAYSKPKNVEKTYLNFHDMQPAWLALGIGLCVSFVGFLGELWKKWVQSRIVQTWQIVRSLTQRILRNSTKSYKLSLLLKNTLHRS